MRRSSLFSPELADPFHHPTSWDRFWISTVSLATGLYAFVLPWALLRMGEASWVERAVLLATSFLMALDLPESILRSKKCGRWEGYSGSWLALDVLSVAPFIVLFLGLLEVERRVLGVVGALLGLLKTRKVRHYLLALRLRALRHASTLTVVSLLLWAGLIIHWVASGWLFLRGLDPGESFLSNYLNALYWTGTTLTTVGYGDITPTTSVEKVYSLLTMVAGLAFFGYLVGLVASIWSRRDPGRLEFNQNVDHLSHAVRTTNLPPELQRRIYDYYNYMWRERGWYDESNFLQALPPTLRDEVSVHMKQDVLQQVDLFQEASKSFRQEIARHLRPEVLTPGGYVCREGDEGDKVYFIVRGKVEVTRGSESERIRTQGPGEFFGEISLFTEGPRTASVRALEFTEVYWLSRDAFRQVTARYPRELEPIEEIARAREPDAMGDSST